MQKVVFTDLGGTLLDDKNSLNKALPAVKHLKKKNIPLVMCSSKTRAEIEHYQNKLGINEPFVAENGGAIFIPPGYFDFVFKFDRKISGYLVVQLGTEYSKLCSMVKRLKLQGIPIKSFSEMPAKQIAHDSGMSMTQAKLAKQCEFNEPFKMFKEDEPEVSRILRANGMDYIKRGDYYHLVGKNDEAKAIKILTQLFKKKHKQIKTIGFGCEEHHLGMLENVKVPHLLMKKDKTYSSKKFKKIKDKGPDGWKKAVKTVCK